MARAERFKVVSTLDEAIDTESMAIGDMLRYAEKRDVRMLEAHYFPGKRPTVFNVRSVPHALWETFVMAGGSNEDARYRRAFQAGLESVENLLSDDSDTPGLNWAPSKKLNGNIVIVTDEECNQRFSPSVVLEIGEVIFKHSFLPRRIEVSWELPSLLVECLVRLPFRPAVQSPSTAGTATNSSPSEASDPSTESTVSG